MAFKFPYTSLHEINLDWILEKVKTFAELIPPMEEATTNVQEALDMATEALDDATQAVSAANEAIDTANEAKDIAEQAAQGVIPDGAITTPKLATGAVTAEKIGVGQITTTKINDDAVTNDKLAQDSVTATKIQDGAVTNGKIYDGAVTNVKLSSSLQAIVSKADIALPSKQIQSEVSATSHTLSIGTSSKILFLFFPYRNVSRAALALVQCYSGGDFSTRMLIPSADDFISLNTSVNNRLTLIFSSSDNVSVSMWMLQGDMSLVDFV